MSCDFHILLVDDSPTDVLIIGRALRETNVAHRLTTLADGPSTIDYLLATKSSESSPHDKPDLVLLDLNLPGIDGCQVLEFIKTDPDLKAIPIVILTTSCREEDILQAYHAGANTFIRKPDEYALYKDLVVILNQYWNHLALRPPRET